MSVPPPVRELDTLVLLRAQRGDEAALRLLVETYQDRVFALLSRMLPRATVEDVAQETFLRVFDNLKRFDLDGPARLSTWIIGIAMRRAIDELRKTKKLVSVEHVATFAARERPDRELERRALGEAIAAAVHSLGADAAATFLLSAYHDLSQDEIAREMAVEVGTVKSRLSRARAALREILEAQHER